MCKFAINIGSIGADRVGFAKLGVRALTGCGVRKEETGQLVFSIFLCVQSAFVHKPLHIRAEGRSTADWEIYFSWTAVIFFPAFFLQINF